ncbi:MAG: signal peptidase II [Steroidobacteraceae bacterium]
MSEPTLGWRASGLAWWPLGLIMLALDQFTKEVIQRTLLLHESVYVLPVLDILHTRNTGAAFSFLAQAGGWQRWVFTVFALAVSVAILISLRRTSGRTQRLLCAGLMLIASGAVGNAIDRLRHGYVVDFVAAHWGPAYFPAFNVADACITVGAGMILLDALLEWRRERRTGAEHIQ